MSFEQKREKSEDKRLLWHRLPCSIYQSQGNKVPGTNYQSQGSLPTLRRPGSRVSKDTALPGPGRNNTLLTQSRDSKISFNSGHQCPMARRSLPAGDTGHFAYTRPSHATANGALSPSCGREMYTWPL